MKIPLTIAPDGGAPFQVEAGPRDVLLWERTSKDRSIAKVMAGEITMSDLYALAHVTARRLGKLSVEVSLDDFERGFDVSAELDENADTDQDPSPTAR